VGELKKWGLEVVEGFDDRWSERMRYALDA